jgi:hypothetical protein
VSRLPAPPYAGEGPHALWHVSENPAIRRFEPHVAPTASVTEPRVWAIDTRHLPIYWFPRDCPRGTFWAGGDTSDDDVERFLFGDRTLRVHTTELRRLRDLRETTLYLYRLPEEPFEPDPDGTTGYWVAREPVEPLERVELTDGAQRHAEAGIELRFVRDLLAVWERVAASTLDFSGVRLANAR